MNFDYNTTRSHLILSEYGRNVQNMVKYICELPTIEERNKYAQAVIDLMGFLQPHLRDVADFKHKLWDHLHIISGYQIDVDSPYPKPLIENAYIKPEPLAYPQQRITYKHYGKTVENLIEKAMREENAEIKKAMVQSIANFMKMAYVTWNKDNVSDDTIIKDLKYLSGGLLSLDEGVNLAKVEFRAQNPRQSNNNNNNRGRSNNNNNNGKNRQNNNNNNRQRNNNNKPKY
ncbi:hypothetical protein SRABI27_00340 [Pedobacter sp. Bi27]|jgi:hypothetical protein|uniref:DUF4290 domain-containing protein n=1 Tax=unclassified Pedobacter TaxID=2628915 RepID=UPI001D85D8D6|nr:MULTISPECIES: DUF4290 domain-containing protein [unclassified Pedobacter]CAH0143154.1 hypothetical protein SRABI126_00346 [Pedobacter sp. Bi126]CAH0143537.1 hypothetical protein SRABI27_00340 [Pedobacter sp. Bi27]CAH0215128.1 hypothetical protein SRABI36_02335 [Pedobacter sp. Bi36]